MLLRLKNGNPCSRKLSGVFACLIAYVLTIASAMGQPVARQITVDASAQGSAFRPVWASFGYDEPNYTYMKDGKKLLTELAALSPVPVYVRTHNLLTSGDGTPALKWGSTNAYTEGKDGIPLYDWTLVDSILDVYVERGMKPLVEIGFMPEALSTQPVPYRHEWKPGVDYNKIYTGWAHPPSDYRKWGSLVYEWVKHSVKRYGPAEVKSWWWEVWNEPNIGYWQGTQQEYFKLYDYAADAVKRAFPQARIGGPATTGPGWDKAAAFLRNFLKHCTEGKNLATGATGSPLDFISFHAKGGPRIIGGHVLMNMSPQLRDVARGFEIVNTSAFAHLPVLITECDPEGCAACGMATNPENAYRNGTMYSSYTAASFARIFDLAERYNVNLQAVTSWSFEFEGQRWFDGFRDLATNGVDKPVLNVFRMYGLMRGYRIAVRNQNDIPLDSILKNSVRGGTPDVHALAVGDSSSVSIMVWNYHDSEDFSEPATVHLAIKNIPSTRVLVMHYRIDADHSNAYELWKTMDSPQHVSDDAYRRLERAGQLQLLHSPQWLSVQNGEASLEFALPPRGVSMVSVQFY